jgi:hypothetical protein
MKSGITPFITDDVHKGDIQMSGNIQENITRSGIWLRLVYMVVLGIAFHVAEFVIWVVVVFQFLTSLFTGKPNDRLTRLGRNLAHYIKQVMVFLTFAGEEKPFPFAPWPEEPHDEAVVDDKGGQMQGSSEAASSATRRDEAAKPKAKTTRKTSTSRKSKS